MISRPGSTPLLFSTRPQLFIDGQENADLAGDLLALTVEETADGVLRCEAIFSNWGSAGSGAGFIYFDRKTLDFGRHLRVRVGSKSASADIFAGRIMAIEARFPEARPPEIMVLAEDALQDLRRTRRTRTFEDLSDSDVIAQVAAEHGLQAIIDVDGPVHQVLVQVNQSDLDFLRARARAIDAELWVAGDALHAQARSRRDAGDLTLTYGERLKEFTALADLSDQCTSLSVSGWDVNAKEAIDAEAAEDAIQAELDGRQSGSSALETALGPRAERLVELVPHTQAEAQALAEAQYRTRARRFVTGTGVSEGDGRLRVGTHLTLQGLGELFDGEYFVTQVQHVFTNQDGLLTHFSVERPGLGEE